MYLKAFVTGADKQQQDILDWFLNNYKINIPLFIADFGLDKVYPNSFKITPIGKTWLSKPLAISKVPATHIIWLDCDIEIKQDISDMFEMIIDDYLVSKDHAVRSDRWQTGIVGIKDKAVLNKWIDRCNTQLDRSDQESFNQIANQFKINTLPNEYHGLRLGNNNDIAKTIHWTGDNGKQIIREKIYKSEQKLKHCFSSN